MHLRIIGATILALGAASATVLVAEVPPPPAAQAPQFIPNSADCNFNLTADRNEVAWANRDDDGDGVCNGVDICPLGTGMCEMQAVTVPAKADDPLAPHVTYSGAMTTLKGIARNGGNQYRWDYGDGSAPMPWTAISNPHNLGVNRVYTGPVGQTFTATLSVRNSAAPDTVATASYPIVIKDGGSALASLTREQTDVRAQLAIDQALWYLHATLTRGTYTDGSPGYRQPWANSNNSLKDSCVVTAAFAAHGHVAADPGAGGADSYHYNPYVESVRRLLNYISFNAGAPAITTQPAGNPDRNGNGIGVAIGGIDILTNGVCAMAFAGSAKPNWFAGTGPANVYGRVHSEIAEDISEWLAFAQNDSGSSRGGWGNAANDGASNNGGTRWVVMGLEAQEARMGATLPMLVRGELPYWLTYARRTVADYWHGSTGYDGPGSLNTVAHTAGMLFGSAFQGRAAHHPEVQAAIGFIARAWTENDSQQRTNLGDSNTMFSAARAFRSFSPAVTLISDFDPLTNQPLPATAFHWYYGPAGAPQQGYAGNLIGRQAGNGMFADTPSFDENGFSQLGRTALGAMVLAAQGAPATATPSPTSLDFGSVDLGSTSSREVTLTNQGDYDFPVGAISATGPFQLTSACGGSLPATGAAASSSCTVYITFEPAAGGAAAGVLTVADAAGSPVATVALSGVGVAPKETPAVTWTPASIIYGTPLGALQLNATATVAGTFSYSPAAGTLLNAGAAQELAVTFTPADTDRYESVTTTASIDVAPASPAIALAAPAATYDGHPHAASASATGVQGEPLGPITITYDGQSDPPVSAGSYTVVASLAAGGNYTAATATRTLVIGKATPVISVTGGTYEYDGQPHAAVASAVGVTGEDLGPVSLTYNGAAAAPVNGGTYAVIAALPASANHVAASATATIVIVGGPVPTNTAPVCSTVAASTRSVWPANGKWIDVTLGGAVDAEGGPLQYRIAGIFQDEATDSTGDRNTAIDGRGIGTSTASVRAERQGNGNGRMYHITFVVTDQGGLSCTGTVTVGVPHNQKAPVVDDGPLFNSTIATAGRGGR